MKKLLVLLLLTCFLCTACASEMELPIPSKEFPGKFVNMTFEPYGLFDSDIVADPRVQYQFSVGNVVWSVILSETIIVPIILMGWYAKKPVGLAKNQMVQ